MKPLNPFNRYLQHLTAREKGDGRKEMGERRWEKGDRRKDVGERRQEKGDRRKETGDGRIINK